MTTANDVIEEAMRLMLGTVHEQMNKLAAPASAGAQSLSFAYDLGGIQPGSLVSVDLEVFRVWTVDTTTKTATVQPAFQGTTSADHGAGALVYVNPRITRAAAFKALNDELHDLSSPQNGLFRMKALEFSPTVNAEYDLTNVSDFISGYEVRQALPGFSDWVTVVDWRVVASQNQVDFPSGYALELPGVAPTWRIRFTYRAKFDDVTTLTDDLESVAGLPSEAHDIPALGILMRLGPVRDIQRSFMEAQGSSRRAEEVPANSITTSFRSVATLREQRINAEAARLIRLYPLRHF